MVKHLVFDFGGVILDLDGVHTGYPPVLTTIFNLPLDQTKQIWEENKTLVTTGKESPEEFLARMKQELQLNFNVNEGLAFWEKSNVIARESIDWDLVKMLAELKKTYQVHLLTDQIQLSNGAEAWISEINSHFQTILRSYEQGYRKTDPAAFQNLLLKINAQAEPSSVVFIDDLSKNTQAATALGINSILYRFKDHTLLRSELARLGVKLPAATSLIRPHETD